MEIKNQFIILSDHSEDYHIPKKQAPWNEDILLDSDETYCEEENENETIDIAFIQRKFDKIPDKKIHKFIKFCLNKKLFNDIYYDYGNDFSVIATYLPDTFADISKGDRIVNKDKFKKMFIKKYKFSGDIDYIYKYMDDDNKGYITWDNFKEFFLPYVKNISL